ncbi:MAG: nuclear transport factor 2 family protein [Pseudomonadota bacterium]
MSSKIHRVITTITFMLLLPMHQVALAKPPPRLGAMDYIEIQQLVNRLSFALDYCTNGGQDFADLFAKGGQFIIDEGDGKPRVFSGREQLLGVAGGPDCKANQVPPRSYVLHLSEALVIEASADGAHGKSYAIYPANKGKYLKEDVAGQMGIYHDEYVRTADGWRFKLRRHETNPAVGGK